MFQPILSYLIQNNVILTCFILFLQNKCRLLSYYVMSCYVFFSHLSLFLKSIFILCSLLLSCINSPSLNFRYLILSLCLSPSRVFSYRSFLCPISYFLSYLFSSYFKLSPLFVSHRLSNHFTLSYSNCPGFIFS